MITVANSCARPSGLCLPLVMAKPPSRRPYFSNVALGSALATVAFLYLLSTPTELTMSYKPTIFARLQSDIQASLRASIWIPGVRNPHMYRAKYQVSGSLEEVQSAISAGVAAHDTEFQMSVAKTEPNFVQAYAYTKAEWLDVSEFSLSNDGSTSVNVDVLAFSSGFVPVAVPLAPVLNGAMAWFPFSDMGMNYKRVSAIMKHVQQQGYTVTKLTTKKSN
eukprot:TRINITY_DN10086_c0_g1_i3.p2 TRINITY_DN10086_c0_g1~~TRINITY_DN10086_c0_g1_i3.p2  ORF type:complete len:220 (+),score=29.29 TRINITY_DN10086_c0_g1_i3:1592-2251(+)